MICYISILYFYISIIRPVLEYAVAVWHTDLTADLSDQLEAIQKCALRIIFGGSSFTNQSYELIHLIFHHCLLAEMTWLRGFFIHFLIPPAACVILFLTKGIILK